MIDNPDELDADAQAVIANHRAFLTDEVRSDPATWQPLVHPAFYHVGFGGSEVTFATLGDHFGRLDGRVEMDILAADKLSDDVILLLWRGTSKHGVVHRGSVWVRTDDGWQLRYQQGTVLP